MANIDKESTLPNLPPYGWMVWLAGKCGCDKMTVRLAIRNNQRGRKSELVRQEYAKQEQNGWKEMLAEPYRKVTV